MKLWRSGDLQGATLASQWTFTPSTTGESPEPGPGPGTCASPSLGTISPGPGQDLDQSKSSPIYVPDPVPVFVLVLFVVLVLVPVLFLVPSTILILSKNQVLVLVLDSLGRSLYPFPDLKLLVPCRSVIVIGAPKASNNQSGVEEGGAVYLCPWNTSDVTSSMCDVINLDATGVFAPPSPPLRGVACCV